MCLAVGEVDFIALDAEIITFRADQNRMCIDVMILNDNLDEDLEDFFIILDTEDLLVNIDPTRQNGTAVITDDDGKLAILSACKLYRYLDSDGVFNIAFFCNS